MRAALLIVAIAACGTPPAGSGGSGAKVRLWHNFNPQETEALNAALERRGGTPVEITRFPFSRGLTILERVLETRKECPDLVRIDATWLPALASAGLLAEAPGDAGRHWLPEAAELTELSGTSYAVPQSLDGLALVYRTGAIKGVDWPPKTVDDLTRAAARLAHSSGDSLSVRVDGFWYAAFLRARDGDVLDPATGRLGIDEPVAAEALTAFAQLFGPKGPVPARPAAGAEEQDEIRQFRNGTVQVAVTGPWSAYDLGSGSPDGLEVSAFPRSGSGRPAAPRGGQLLAVPACAEHPADGWALAYDLTAPRLQAEWSRRFGIVPTTTEALETAGEFSRSFYAALRAARPLPRHALTPQLFDDLTPAIAAVVATDATPDEALAGVARAWSRLLLRHGITPAPAPAP